MIGTGIYVHLAKKNIVRVQFGFLLVDGLDLGHYRLRSLEVR
jgi:hypothetical protein